MKLREKAALDFIAGKIAADGVAPSVREIRDALKLASTSYVWRLLVGLEQQQKIRRLYHQSRAMELTPAAKSEYGLVPLVAYPNARYYLAVREGERTVLTEIQWTPPNPAASSPSPGKA